MRGLALLASVALLALSLEGQAAMAAGPEPVEFRDGNLTLKGFLYRPDGPGPFPAVVAMHNCGGLVNASGTIGTRYRDWALQLVKAGFVVLFPDSYGSRGLANQCAVRNQPVRADRERVTDATAARRWLQTQPEVKADRISLLGWSNGATGDLGLGQHAVAGGNASGRSMSAHGFRSSASASKRFSRKAGSRFFRMCFGPNLEVRQ